MDEKPWEVEQDWYRTTAKRVFAVLAVRKITMHRLSILSGVSYYQTWRYLKESRRMPAYALFRYARCLGVTVSELVGDGTKDSEQGMLDLGD